MSMDIQRGHLRCPWIYRAVIWDVHGHTGGSSGVSMDIQGGHLRCPWTYRGSSGVSMDIQGGHLGCPWTYRGLPGLSRGRGRRPHQWPEGPQPSAGTRNKRAKHIVITITIISPVLVLD